MMTLSLVIPAYNEAERLPATLESLRGFLQANVANFEIDKIVIVDDGSTDQTSKTIQAAKLDWPAIDLICFEKNYGKGRAVREGLRYCLKSALKTEWILMADADGATDWSALLSAKKITHEKPDMFLIIGSRQHPDSILNPRQSWFREFLGKGFNFILRAVTFIPFKDTQCGFKIFKKDLRLKTLVDELTLDRFAWDAEALLKCRDLGYPLAEVPVRWSHRVDSRVHMIHDSLEMLFSLIRIRLAMARRINKR